MRDSLIGAVAVAGRKRLWLWMAMAGAGSAMAAMLPPVEELAPGVYAAGFTARYESANSGWIHLGDQTMLIDTPRGMEISAYLDLVEKSTGTPVRSLALTHLDESNRGDVAKLVERGLHQVSPPAAGGVVEIAGRRLRFIPYQNRSVSGDRAIYIERERILFGGPLVVNGPRMKLAGIDTSETMAALSSLEKLGALRVVPGFGSWGKAPVLERERTFLGEVRRQVGYQISQGVALEALQKQILIPAAYSVWMPYDTPSAEDIRAVYSELTIPMAPYGGRPPEANGSQAEALVLIGDRFHEPGHLEEGLRPVFAATGVTPHFLVDPRGLTAENLSHVRLLVILRDGYIWPEGKGVSWMEPGQQAAVVQFVENGGSFLNLHNSMGLYPDNGPYLQLMAGRYIGHGPLERFWTEVVDPQHPVTRGVTNFFCADEQHTPPCDTNVVHLLLRNRSEDGAVVAAAGWTREVGKGRVCHLANGHTREALGHPMFQRLMQNAVNWCLRREE